MADSLADAIIGGVESVTATWAKQRKAEERHASAARNRRDVLTRARQITIRDAAWQVMQDAYDKASSGGRFYANARQVFYAARPQVLAMTGKHALDSRYFTQTLLPDYISEAGLEGAWKIVSKREDWPTHRHRRHMSADDAAKLEPSQPFHVAGRPGWLTPLGVLAALSNADKHRAVNVIVTNTRQGRFDNDEWACQDCELHDDPVRVDWVFSGQERVDEEVMRFPVIATGPNPDVKVNVRITREVTFEQTWPAIECLDNIGIVVAKILGRF